MCSMFLGDMYLHNLECRIIGEFGIIWGEGIFPKINNIGRGFE